MIQVLLSSIAIQDFNFKNIQNVLSYFIEFSVTKIS